MAARIDQIMRMSNHLHNQNQFQQQQLKQELESEKKDFADTIDREINKIDMKI